jgi:hypothetical protein
MTVKPLVCFVCLLGFAALFTQLGCSPQKPIALQKVSFSPVGATSPEKSEGKSLTTDSC